MNQFYFKINLNKYGDLKLQAERENKQFIQAVIVFGIGIVILLAAHFLYQQPAEQKGSQQAEVPERDASSD